MKKIKKPLKKTVKKIEKPLKELKKPLEERIDDPKCVAGNATCAQGFFEKLKETVKKIEKPLKETVKKIEKPLKELKKPLEELKKPLKELLKKPLDLFQEAAEIVDKSRIVFEGAKAALSAAQDTVSAARGTLDNAIAGLTVVKEIYRAGVEALSAIANFALTEIINIREMYFKVALSVADGGEFKCRVKGVLMGNNIDLDLEFDIRNPLDLAKSLGEKAISGIANFFG